MDNRNTIQDSDDIRVNLKLKLKTLSTHTRQTSNRILNYCDETEKLGINASMLLVEQDEKLNKIDRGVEKMSDELKKVETNINNLNRSGACLAFRAIGEILIDCFICKTKTSKSSDIKTLTSSNDKPKKSLFSKLFKNKKKSYSKNPDNKNVTLMLNDRNLPIFDYLIKSDSGSSFNSMSYEYKRDIITTNISNLKSSLSSPLLTESNEKNNPKTALDSNKYNRRKSSFSVSLIDLRKNLGDNLKKINFKLDSLQSMAIDIGNELNKQNRKLELVSSRTDLASVKVKTTENTGKKLI